MEKEKEPGTARFGNFINYYRFNPPQNRLDLLPTDLLDTLELPSPSEVCVLDIGSNSGDLTKAAYERFLNLSPPTNNSDTSSRVPHTDVEILGDALGQVRAGAATHAPIPCTKGNPVATNNCTADPVISSDASRTGVDCSPGTVLLGGQDTECVEANESTATKHADCTTCCSTRPQKQLDILGVELDEHLVHRSKEANPYPDNISFVCGDLMKAEDRENTVENFLEVRDRSAFDLTLCLSVTLWIHLNHGDTGLQDFLRYISSRSRYLLLEPQPWRCYQTAARRMRRAGCAPFVQLEQLQWRHSVDEEIMSFLTERCGMKLVKSYGRTDWKRRLCLLRNTCWNIGT